MSDAELKSRRSQEKAHGLVSAVCRCDISRNLCPLHKESLGVTREQAEQIALARQREARIAEIEEGVLRAMRSWDAERSR